MKYLAVFLVFLFVQNSSAQAGRYKGDLKLVAREYLGSTEPSILESIIASNNMFTSKVKIDLEIQKVRNKLKTKKYSLDWKSSKNKLTAFQTYPSFSIFREFYFSIFPSTIYCDDRADLHNIVKNKNSYSLTFESFLLCKLQIGSEYKDSFVTHVTYKGRVRKS